MEGLVVSLLNGISYGLLLFMLSAGLTLVFSMMGVINVAHASFYMVGAYAAYALSTGLSRIPGLAGAAFWIALFLAPMLVGVLGAVVERFGLRRLRGRGHVPELLFTFALAYIAVELVQLLWGRAAVPFSLPAALEHSLFSVYGTQFPAYRVGIAAVAALMLAALWAVLHGSRAGLVIQAAMTHPQMVEALGHDVPRVLTWVFGGGCLLAALAGVVGGSVFVTEPGMALAVGPIVFVVAVVGGLGSLLGAFVASMSIGILQTLAVGVDASLGSLITGWGGSLPAGSAWASLLDLPLARVAPVLPYLAMVLVLIWRPQGLMGTRET